MPILHKSDLLSPVWLKLKAWAEERRESHRGKLEADRPDEQTAKLRGRIAEIKAFLDIEREANEAKE